MEAYWVHLSLGLSFLLVSPVPLSFAEETQAVSNSNTASYKELSDYTLSYREAAEAGDAPSQYNLGAAYRWGVGTAQNLPEAIRWMRASADKGYPPAQRTVGSLYESGEGYPQSNAEALKWYKRASAQGDELARDAFERLHAKMTPSELKP